MLCVKVNLQSHFGIIVLNKAILKVILSNFAKHKKNWEKQQIFCLQSVKQNFKIYCHFNPFYAWKGRCKADKANLREKVLIKWGDSTLNFIICGNFKCIRRIFNCKIRISLFEASSSQQSLKLLCWTMRSILRLIDNKLWWIDREINLAHMPSWLGQNGINRIGARPQSPRMDVKQLCIYWAHLYMV